MNKHEALAAAVTGIDDELLQEAANGLPAPHRPVFARWGAMAAALLLVFGISVLWQHSGALRLLVGNTVIGSRSVPVTQSAAPRTVEEPVMYSDEPLELTLTLSCRGEWQLAVSAGEVRVTQGESVSPWRRAAGQRQRHRPLGTSAAHGGAELPSYRQYSDHDPFSK